MSMPSVDLSTPPITCFNPLPSPKQGEISNQRTDGFASIAFQSAPLTEARGDQQPPDGSVRLDIGFNPLPSPKQGEMRRQFDQRQFDRVSIRSPHRSKGRFTMVLGPPERGLKFQSAPLTEARGDTYIECQSSSGVLVSIRSPHRSKGRSAAAHTHVSKLPSRSKGRSAESSLSRGPHRVSIRSPHRSKGR